MTGRKVKATHIFWKDKTAYCFVCSDCFAAFKHRQWPGGDSDNNWRAYQRRAYRELEKGQLCQWCLNDSYPQD